MKKISLIAAVFLLLAGAVYAQRGNVDANAEQDIVVTNLTGDLNFGSVIQNQGTVQIQLTAPETVVLQVEGKENQRIRVTFTPPADLRLDASNALPFTLRAAYNETGNNDASGATAISLPVTSETFKLPNNPGPDKTGTAYIYIHGDISVGTVNAGTYSGTINVFVEYD